MTAVAACWAMITGATIAAVLVGVRSAVADTAPLVAFGRLPSLEDVVISPDGTKIAFVKTDGDNRSLVVAPLGSKREILGGVRVGKDRKSVV